MLKWQIKPELLLLLLYVEQSFEQNYFQSVAEKKFLTINANTILVEATEFRIL